MDAADSASSQKVEVGAPGSSAAKRDDAPASKRAAGGQAIPGIFGEYKLRLPANCIVVTKNKHISSPVDMEIYGNSISPTLGKALDDVPGTWGGTPTTWSIWGLYQQHPLMAQMLLASESEEPGGVEDKVIVPCAWAGDVLKVVQAANPAIGAIAFTRGLLKVLSAYPASPFFRGLPEVTVDMAFPKVYRPSSHKNGKGHPYERVVPVALFPFLRIFYDEHDAAQLSFLLDILAAKMLTELSASTNIFKRHWYCQLKANIEMAREVPLRQSRSEALSLRSEVKQQREAMSARDKTITRMDTQIKALQTRLDVHKQRLRAEALENKRRGSSSSPSHSERDAKRAKTDAPSEQTA